MTRPGWAEDPHIQGLEVYRVGGAVRDGLLGLGPSEEDFVVVGASPEELVRRGFKPVGRDFPVFLHPEKHTEFALARTERKSAPGYRGFNFHAGPEVTLADDLRRRDLTVNAIAEDADGRLVDPFSGRRDLEHKCLRHVSPAFSEDPVRLLRLARFATRFPEFSIAAETLELCRELVASGEVDHLVPERVWQEMARALMHAKPSRFFEVLRETGALARILPEVDALFGVPQVKKYHPEIDAGAHTLMVIEQAARLDACLPARFACLVHDLGKALTSNKDLPSHPGHEISGLEPVRAVCERLKVPNECRDLALLVCEFHLKAHRALEMKPASVLKLFENLDAFRKPDRFEQFLLACEADKRGRTGREQVPYPQAAYLRRALATAAAVPVQPLTDAGLQGRAVADALRSGRTTAIAGLKRPDGNDSSPG